MPIPPGRVSWTRNRTGRALQIHPTPFEKQEKNLYTFQQVLWLPDLSWKGYAHSVPISLLSQEINRDTTADTCGEHLQS